MDWTFLIIVVGVLGAWVWFKRSGLLRQEEAVRLLREGAPVFDVRTPAEFAREHLEGTLNLPMGEEVQRLPQLVPDRTQPVLLFCFSGGRSAISKSRLRRAGYGHVHNLGSYARAAALLRSARTPSGNLSAQA